MLEFPLITAKQSFDIDQTAQEKHKLSSETLMESAGAVSAREIYSRFHPQSVLILCGPGNNGGDGLVTARHLSSKGISTTVFIAPDAKSQLIEKQKQRLNQPIQNIEDLKKIKSAEKNSDVIVDALFGIGLSKNISGFYLKLIEWIHSSKKKKVSLDTPSGLDVDTGQVKGAAIPADLTLTFGLAKPGFYLNQGPQHTGEVKIFSIGFPNKLLKEKACTHFLLPKSYVRTCFPQRKPTDHKAQLGHLLVLAGREGFWGAGRLCAESAYRMGVGYVTWAGKNQHPPLGSLPDVLTQKRDDPHLFSKKTATALGPGLGCNEDTKKSLLLAKKNKLPTVVDADAFTLCVREKLFPLPKNWITTPHSGELGRLFEVEGKEIDQDRTSYALQASQILGCSVLLKGFHSVLASHGRCWIISSGNSALAKAGTGDVLTGFIGALLARGVSALEAGALGALIHGQIADDWIQAGKHKDTLMAKDLKELLPFTLQKLLKTTQSKQ